ncbi:MAG TPA: LodA/GoxA family CTQ-dependent oxidase, partial [Anaerolineales bacterium]|nr:LodA/GoxA family CTQ-dependent oxidase [Anaerolineales bacterium]
MTSTDRIKFCKIHPAIGIARVGNSPNEYFIGPEIPGVAAPPQGGYKDSGDLDELIPPRVKRQAARFRVFGYDDKGRVIKELTSDDAEITWTVHLVNQKAAWRKFMGSAGEKVSPPGKSKPASALRNKDIKEGRDVLIIDPGPSSLSGPNQSAELVGGTFMGIPVPLGNIQTDEKARLLVLGGFGRSGTKDPGKRIGNYANNDRWYDDVSDGFVVAKVKFKEGQETIPTAPSWAIVAPPDFAPPITNVVTLYDVIFDVAVRNKWIIVEEEPSFTNHIYPLLNRITALQWVNLEALTGHGSSMQGGLDFSDEETLKVLSTREPGDKYRLARERVFNFIRDPNLVEKFRHRTASKIELEEAQAQAQARFMPPLAGDDGDPIDKVPGTWFALTKTQYEMLRKWKDGTFRADWIQKSVASLTIMQTPGALAPGERAETLIAQPKASDNITPEGLDRAALESCAGGAFFPGIEAGWTMRDPSIFVGKNDPFRLNDKNLKPGDITKRMACPWQADFYECNTHWWPAQRPDDVLTLENYLQAKRLDSEIISKRHEIEVNGGSLPLVERLRLLNEIAGLSAQRDEVWRRRDSWDRGLNEETLIEGI